MGLRNDNWIIKVNWYGVAIIVQSKIIYTAKRRSIYIFRNQRRDFEFWKFLINCWGNSGSFRCPWILALKEFCFSFAFILFRTSILSHCCRSYIVVSIHSNTLDELHCIVWLLCENCHSSYDDKINDINK